MVSNKIIVVVLILAIILTIATVVIVVSNNNAKEVPVNIDNSDSRLSVKPAIESGKVSLIINPPSIPEK
jgi:hypothetical protein